MSVQEERLRLGYKLNGQAAEGSLPFFFWCLLKKEYEGLNTHINRVTET